MYRFGLFLTFLAASLSAAAQSSDLQQRIKGFQSELAASYAVKTLNLQGENLGALEKEEPAYQTHFKLEAKEKRYFLNMLEKYKNGTVPLSAVLSVLQSWIIKYEKTYLNQQTYFEPFPENLVEITDSGKGRKL